MLKSVFAFVMSIVDVVAIFGGAIAFLAIEILVPFSKLVVLDDTVLRNILAAAGTYLITRIIWVGKTQRKFRTIGDLSMLWWGVGALLATLSFRVTVELGTHPVIPAFCMVIATLGMAIVAYRLAVLLIPSNTIQHASSITGG